MSIHKSLVSAGKLRRHRNVLTRAERLDILKKEDRWKDEQSIFGLPKVRNIMQRAKKKKEEAAAEGAEAGAAGAAPAAGAPGAAPAAAGAKPAAAAGAKGAAPAAAPAKGAAPAKKEEKKK
jgi:small basic protein (TIGR04137 family)